MRMLAKWTRGLRGKLVLLGAIPPLACLLIVSYSHNMAGKLEDRIKQAYQVRVKLVDQVGDMAGSIHALGRWMWIVNGLTENPDKQVLFINRAKTEIENFENTKKAYSAMVTDAATKEKISNIEMHWAKARSIAEKALVEFSKRTSEGNHEGKDLLANELVKSLVPITEVFQKLGDMMDESLAQEIKETDSEVTTAETFLWTLGTAVSFVTIAMAIFIALRLVQSFSKVGNEIDHSSKETAAASEQLSSASQALSGGATTAAASIEETVGSLEELTSMVKRNSESAQTAGQLSEKSREAAELGQKEVAAMINSMSDLSQSSKRIEEITTVIDDIAFQTNLLALNAAVEAARAGEQGKGFAVVAEAVRSLAQRSAIAAKDISDLIQDNVNKTSQSVALAKKNGELLTVIVEGVGKVTSITHEIAHASQEQSTGLSHISDAIGQLDKTIQENAAASEEAAASSEEMSAQAIQLSIMADTLSKMIDGENSEQAASLPAAPIDLRKAAKTNSTVKLRRVG